MTIQQPDLYGDVDIRNCMTNPEVTNRNDQHPVVMNSIQITQQGNSSKEL